MKWNEFACLQELKNSSDRERILLYRTPETRYVYSDALHDGRECTCRWVIRASIYTKSNIQKERKDKQVVEGRGDLFTPFPHVATNYSSATHPRQLAQDRNHLPGVQLPLGIRPLPTRRHRPGVVQFIQPHQHFLVPTHPIVIAHVSTTPIHHARYGYRQTTPGRLRWSTRV